MKNYNDRYNKLLQNADFVKVLKCRRGIWMLFQFANKIIFWGVCKIKIIALRIFLHEKCASARFSHHGAA